MAIALWLCACGNNATPPPLPDPSLTVTESALQDQFRQLWTERAFWSRALIISTLRGLQDRDAVSARLRKTKDDLAAAFDVFYGTVGAGAQIASYLDTDQNLLESALGQRDPGKTKSAAKDNRKALSDYLKSLNPKWPSSLDNHLDDAIDLAFRQIDQRQKSNWIDDVNAFDGSVKNARELADDFADGLLKEYPSNVTKEQNKKFQKFRLEQRQLWMDHFMWHHFLNVSAVMSLFDLDACRQRALQNSTDLGRSIKPQYGAVNGEHFTGLLREHMLNAELVVNFTRIGEPSGIAQSKVQGYANAESLSQFLTFINPNLPLEVTRPNMKDHQQLVYADIDAQFEADWAAEVSALDEFEAHLLETADLFSTATQSQFPSEVNQ